MQRGMCGLIVIASLLMAAGASADYFSATAGTVYPNDRGFWTGCAPASGDFVRWFHTANSETAGSFNGLELVCNVAGYQPWAGSSSGQSGGLVQCFENFGFNGLWGHSAMPGRLGSTRRYIYEIGSECLDANRNTVSDRTSTRMPIRMAKDVQYFAIRCNPRDRMTSLLSTFAGTLTSMAMVCGY